MSAQERVQADARYVSKTLRGAAKQGTHFVADRLIEAADTIDALLAELARLEQALADALATDWNGVRRKAEEQVARLEQERDIAKEQHANTLNRMLDERDNAEAADREAIAQVEELSADLAAARAREQRLREALAFYANQPNVHGTYSDVLEDGGDRARAERE